MEKSQRSSGKGLMNQIVTARRCFEHSEKMEVSSGYSKTGRFISYRLFNKELMGITQRFLHVGRNDGKWGSTLDGKKRTQESENMANR